MKYLLIPFMLFSANLFAYPHYIGHGYTSCKNCHYNPFGGGIVNDYARVVNATSLASGSLYPKSMSNEDIAYHSDFLFGTYKPKNLRMQLNYRGIKIIQNPGSSKSESIRWINMQQDIRSLVKFGKDDKFLINASMSYTPKGTRSSNREVDESNFRSREHYFGYQLNSKVGLYAGLMDQVYGIKVVEHIAYSRLYPQVSQNDQTHGLAMHYLNKRWEGGAHIFAGNLSQDEELRMKGVSGMLEYTLNDIHRVGGSFKFSSNKFLELKALAAHARLSLKSGSSVQVEVGQVAKNSDALKDTLNSRYALIQTYLRPVRGLYVFTNIEYGDADTSSEDYTIRWGPGIQYLPIHRAELRLDLQNIRNFGDKKSVKDSWQLLLQTHFWL